MNEKELIDAITVAIPFVNEEYIKAILTRLETLGYVVLDTDAIAVAFAVQKVDNKIENLCNTTTVPSGLFNIAVDMVCGEFLFVKKQSGTLAGFNFETTIKQIQAGDTSVTFSDKDISPEQQFDALVSYLMDSGRGEFVCYRKIKW